MDSGSTIFDKSEPGKRSYSLPALDVPRMEPEEVLPAEALRQGELTLPEVSEPEIVRHFIGLSVLNHHVDRDFYPLGSCTMKYNPKVNERVAALDGFAQVHPLIDEGLAQGALGVIYELGRSLCEITGMDDITMAPAAGAHGELTGMLVVRAYHSDRGNVRKKVLIPDSAHGTNPASVRIAGYHAVEVKSGADGRLSPKDLKPHLDSEVAAVMITNPNTLGLFESGISEISEMVHEVGGLLYMDGANMNALLGISRPGDFGIDVVHLNLHKTFSTPHGGGGPGSGPVAVKAGLAPYLPIPLVEKRAGAYHWVADRPKSVGRVHTFCGNFGVVVKAYCYILMAGGDGLAQVAKGAILNANYLMARLKRTYSLPYGGACKHEFVLSGKPWARAGVRTADIGKRLMDYGFHPPTVYFPLIVEEALMIEPTETESKETLDRFADAMEKIASEIESDPELVRGAPYSTPVSRVDEGLAARRLDVAQ
ncbi:MAG TPA: aminomethyl-transferring glycine dehydrogenase subunit GcvPB [bacterium]|nr:aminomethyl-transferring glycine dehydrogenase subunit GcvPB [bacterium]